MGRSSIRLGRIFGIPVGLDWSLLLIAGLLTLSLAADRFPAEFPGEPTAAYWIVGLVAAGLFFASVLAHEIAHSLVARRYGVEVDGITLWMLGGVAKLGGESPTAGAELRIASAGPATSVGLAVLFGLGALAASALGVPGLVGSALGWLALINGVLAVFNLIPAAPLDGGRILASLLWFHHGDRHRAAATAAQVGVVFGWLLVALGGAGWLAGLGFGGLWTALIGWFLVSAARAEGQMARSRLAFGDVHVRDVMTPDPPRVRGWLSVSEFLRDDASGIREPVAMVERFDGTIAGLVSLDRLRSAPPQEGVLRRVQDFAVPVATFRSAHPDDLLADVAARPVRGRVGHTLVFDGDRLVGLVSPEALVPGPAVSRATP
ncbi:MAG TPA: site-2 protease family protein [Acidimicrobiia bacterium]|nr:site-2 protease family protein [Acidimicrobiia bacterium]